MSSISDALPNLLSDGVLRHIDDIKSVNEIRLRLGRKMCVFSGGRYRTTAYTTTRRDIDYTLSIASKSSIFAVEQSIASGYISTDCGIRVGVCGEGVYDGGKYKTLKNISSLTVRVPHEIKSLPIEVIAAISPFHDTLIVSPPSGGKTTMLREIARRLSNRGERVVIIDERFEISGTSNGVQRLDVGENSDVIAGVGKTEAYEIAIRGCNPGVLVTDELFGADDVKALKDCVRCGIRILASIHGDSEASLEFVPGIGGIFKKAIILGGLPNVGKVNKIVDL